MTVKNRSVERKGTKKRRGVEEASPLRVRFPYRKTHVMARCEQGYLCAVCGEEVASMTESDLYLRYVIGEIGPQELQHEPERHIRCNPVQAQFIVDENFEPVILTGPFDKRTLDPADVRRREELLTRGWRRLQQLPGSGLPLSEYPLPEFRQS